MPAELSQNDGCQSVVEYLTEHKELPGHPMDVPAFHKTSSYVSVHVFMSGSFNESSDGTT